MELYLARRYLGMSADEWDGLPWWQRETYLEGYEEEGLVSRGDPTGSAPDHADATASDDDLAGFGVNVTSV